MANLGRVFCLDKPVLQEPLLCKVTRFSLPRKDFPNSVNARVLNNLETVMPPEMRSSCPCSPAGAGVAPAEGAACRAISGGSAVSSSINVLH